MVALFKVLTTFGLVCLFLLLVFLVNKQAVFADAAVAIVALLAAAYVLGHVARR